jgi:Cu(I)/Ag(I) efflux system membrane fusion protein
MSTYAKRVVLVLAGAALLSGVAVGAYLLGRASSAPSASSSAAASTEGGAEVSQKDRKILYWHDPMYPQHKFDKPGRSPFMDMQLEPVYADEAGDDGSGTRISPRIIQNLGVRTVPVEVGSLARTIDTVGTVAFDQHRIQVVESRAAGWVERLHVRAENDPIKRGQVLAEVYAPDIYAAQEEFLLALKQAQANPADESIADAARTRLSLLGLSERQIRDIESNGKSQRRIAIYSPLSGIVAKLNVREGQQVAPGMVMFNVVDLSTVWITAEIVENQAAWVTQGKPVDARVAALPGKVFKGRVQYVYPEVMRETRTLMARIELKNPNLELKPGMFADLTLYGEEKRDAMMVPTEAVIKTGERSVVIVAEGEGKFRPMEVATGMEAGGMTEIMKGLERDQQVVASGQFLIDSEASLRGALNRLQGQQEVK